MIATGELERLLDVLVKALGIKRFIVEVIGVKLFVELVGVQRIVEAIGVDRLWAEMSPKQREELLRLAQKDKPVESDRPD